jgi:hypothetical protein
MDLTLLEFYDRVPLVSKTHLQRQGNKMRFTTENVSADGTWLHGHIVATRRELEATFGAPSFEGDDGKTTTEWDILFIDGTISTIYDWKRYDLGAPSMDERITWNVGGTTYLSVERVEDSLLIHA